MKLSKLTKITSAIELDQLSQEQVAELQRALDTLGYPVGPLDGLLGAKTRTAWAEFKIDEFQGNPDLIGPGGVQLMQERLDEITSKSKHDFATKAGTIKAIIQECKAQGLSLPTQIAYVLATVQWETAQTYMPVEEAYYLGNAQEQHLKTKKYYPYYGRGYVQLTWKANYQKYENLLHESLVASPELALKPEIALFVLVHGFKTGVFTGRKLEDYVNDKKTDFVNARRCINGADKAHQIAAMAQKHLTTL